MRAFSKVMSKEPRMAVARDRRRAIRVRKEIGIRARPRMAGKERMMMYGTWLDV